MKANRAGIRRPDMRKAVFLFPSGLTLLNLFFGVFAIIAASRLEFVTAGVYVVIGGICDALDGRVARATNAGSEFGEELDSLVDAITFGLAPGMIMYFAVLNRGGWDWVWVFAFVAAAVLRLARFNIEQAGTAKTYFQGLPSPAAGITLASYYWFSESWLYSYGAIANIKWHVALRIIMAVLAALMISNVPYPSFPRTGYRSLRSLGASIVVFGSFALLLTGKLEYFFPIAVLYVAFGLVRWVFFGLFERRQPTVPYDLSEGEDDEDDMFEVPEPVRPPRGSRDDVAGAGSRTERGRGRAERAERPERPARGERPARTPSAPPERATSVASVAVEEDEEEAPRAERPQRTDADRAARREKREKRDKRDRGDRPARPDRGDRANVTVLDDDAPSTAPSREPEAAALGMPTVPADEQVIGAIPGGADEGAGVEAGPARKRKRRRRRGARDRGEAVGGGDAGGDDGGTDDGPGSDEGSDAEPRSPYAAAPAAPPAVRPFTPPLPSPAPAATPAPAAGPSTSERAE
jgi:CDP-diacylglycerol--serine O-phosphatidyltransferase